MTICIVVLGITAYDLYIAGVKTAYTTYLPHSIIERRFQSEFRSVLDREPKPVRVFSPGQNLVTSLGIAVTPGFLGLSPVEYVDPATNMPEPMPFDAPATADQIEWLQRAGVTHVISFKPLEPFGWPVELLWPGVDGFLNLAWARNEPIYLYRLKGSRGRVAWETPVDGASATILEYRANRVAIEANSPPGGWLILTDLLYPGWQVFVDDQVAEPLVIEGQYRGVELPPGRHRVEWVYRPWSVYIGAVVSCAALLLWCVLFWRTRSKPTSGLGQTPK